MKKRIRILAAAVLAVLVLASSAGASGVCRSASAYSVWKLIARCQAGLPQSCAAVPQTAGQTAAQTAVQTGTRAAAQTGAGSAAASPAGSAASGYAAQVVQLVNAIRQQYGLSALTENTALSAVAQAKAQDMLPQNETVENAIQELIDAKIPYTAADRIISSVAPSAVSNIKYDNVEIGAAAAAYLVSNGMVGKQIGSGRTERLRPMVNTMDTCQRVGGDPARKLAQADRLIGSSLLALEQGVTPAYIAVGAAGAVYRYLNEAGTEQSCEAARKVLEEVSGLTADQALTGMDTPPFSSSYSKTAELQEL